MFFLILEALQNSYKKHFFLTKKMLSKPCRTAERLPLKSRQRSVASCLNLLSSNSSQCLDPSQRIKTLFLSWCKMLIKVFDFHIRVAQLLEAVCLCSSFICIWHLKYCGPEVHFNILKLFLKNVFQADLLNWLL